MKHIPLPRSFYNRNTAAVAKELLGKTLARRLGRTTLRGRIVETEAYVGPQDLASHASRGKTKRNAPMFGPPGHAYIYLVYGMYWCLNVVTEKKGYPAAVLIRALEFPNNKTDGPGKLCRAFHITSALNTIDLTKPEKLWIEDAPSLPRSQIIATPRIGVDYAKSWRNKKLRFLENQGKIVKERGKYSFTHAPHP